MLGIELNRSMVMKTQLRDPEKDLNDGHYFDRILCTHGRQEVSDDEGQLWTAAGLGPLCFRPPVL